MQQPDNRDEVIAASAAATKIPADVLERRPACTPRVLYSAEGR
jgi:hypothetical protein